MYSFVSTISLEPEPIPLDVKVVLFGERHWYYLLFAHDPDFAELFKVAVDFDDEIARDAGNQDLLARLIATLARRNAMLPFDRAAVARLIETRARDVEDSERLSTHVQSLIDLMTEAEFGARRAGVGAGRRRPRRRRHRRRAGARRAHPAADARADPARLGAGRHRRRGGGPGQRPVGVRSSAATCSPSRPGSPPTPASATAR